MPTSIAISDYIHKLIIKKKYELIDKDIKVKIYDIVQLAIERGLDTITENDFDKKLNSKEELGLKKGEQ